MPRASATFRKARLAAGLLLLLAPLPVLAQDTPRDTLHSSYALWGMMEAAAVYCAEQLPGDFSIPLTHLDWVSRNTLIMDELEATRDMLGEPELLAFEGRKAGSDGASDLLRQATNPAEVCANWKAQTETGGYDAETFLADQLGTLRERDGF
jgi:hypothetical protein